MNRPRIDCAIEGCARRTIGDAPWCVTHLRQMSIAGDPFAGRQPAGPTATELVEEAAGEVERPKSQTSRRELWEAYALSLGADVDEISPLTKLELIARCDELATATDGEPDES